MLYIAAIVCVLIAYQWEWLGYGFDFYFRFMAVAWFFVTIAIHLYAKSKENFAFILFTDFCMSLALGNLITELFLNPTVCPITNYIAVGIGGAWVLYKIIKQKYALSKSV